VVDVTSPIRSEPLIDLQTGNITIRFATFLDNLSTTVNETVIITEGTSEVGESQALKAQSLIAEMKKDVEAIDQALESMSMLNAKIAEMEKRINNLEELVE